MSSAPDSTSFKTPDDNDGEATDETKDSDDEQQEEEGGNQHQTMNDQDGPLWWVHVWKPEPSHGFGRW